MDDEDIDIDFYYGEDNYQGDDEEDSRDDFYRGDDDEDEDEEKDEEDENSLENEEDVSENGVTYEAQFKDLDRVGKGRMKLKAEKRVRDPKEKAIDEAGGILGTLPFSKLGEQEKDRLNEWLEMFPSLENYNIKLLLAALVWRLGSKNIDAKSFKKIHETYAPDSKQPDLLRYIRLVSSMKF